MASPAPPPVQDLLAELATLVDLPPDLPALLALLPGADLSLQDELRAALHPTLTRVWSPRGRRGQRHVEAPGRNAKVVGSKRVRAFLADHPDEVVLVYTPAYDPDANRIEWLWRRSAALSRTPILMPPFRHCWRTRMDGHTRSPQAMCSVRSVAPSPMPTSPMTTNSLMLPEKPGSI